MKNLFLTVLYFLFVTSAQASKLKKCSITDSTQAQDEAPEKTLYDCKNDCRAQSASQPKDIPLFCFWDGYDYAKEALLAGNTGEDSSEKEDAPVPTEEKNNVAVNPMITASTKQGATTEPKKNKKKEPEKTPEQKSVENWKKRSKNMKTRLKAAEGLALDESLAKNLNKRLKRIDGFAQTKLLKNNTPRRRKILDARLTVAEAIADRATGKGYASSAKAFNEIVDSLQKGKIISASDKKKIRSQIVAFKAKHDAYAIDGISPEEDKKLNDEFNKLNSQIMKTASSNAFYDSLSKKIDNMEDDYKKSNLLAAQKSIVSKKAKKIVDDYDALRKADPVKASNQKDKFNNRLVDLDREFIKLLKKNSKPRAASNTAFIARAEARIKRNKK